MSFSRRPSLGPGPVKGGQWCCALPLSLSFPQISDVRICEQFANLSYFADKSENVVREAWKYLLSLCINIFKIMLLSFLNLESMKNSNICKSLEHVFTGYRDFASFA